VQNAYPSPVTPSRNGDISRRPSVGPPRGKKHRDSLFGYFVNWFKVPLFRRGGDFFTPGRVSASGRLEKMNCYITRNLRFSLCAGSKLPALETLSPVQVVRANSFKAFTVKGHIPLGVEWLSSGLSQGKLVPLACKYKIPLGMFDCYLSSKSSTRELTTHTEAYTPMVDGD
jgi:hypothetical protein